MPSRPANRLVERRLREIERERAALRRRIDTLSRLPDDFPPVAPPSPRLRTTAIPAEWRITHPDETPAHVAAAVAPDATSEFAPPPPGVRVDAPSSAAPRRVPRSPTPIGESAPPDRLGAYLGAQPAFRGRHQHLRSKANEGSYRARAIFAVLMVLLLAFLAIRLFT